MQINVNLAKCIKCRTCEVICPTSPSVFNIDGEVRVPNQDLCIHCGVCISQCPVQAITIE